MTPPPARFFGYGSLVNLASHDASGATLARLTGWRRVWRRAPMRKAAFLSVEPCPSTAIDGVLAEVPGGDWSALDAREAAYEKHEVGGSIAPCSGGPVTVYALPRATSVAPCAAHPILLSYIDVVVTGFLDLYGPAGADHFFATTVGWTGPVQDDRAAPIYPRAACASDAGRQAVTARLTDTGAHMLRP